DIGALPEALLDQSASRAFEFVFGQFAGPDRLGRNIPFRVHLSPEQACLSDDSPSLMDAWQAHDKAKRRPGEFRPRCRYSAPSAAPSAAPARRSPSVRTGVAVPWPSTGRR